MPFRLLLLCLFITTGCVARPTTPSLGHVAQPAATIAPTIDAIVKRHGMRAAAVGIVRGGGLAWDAYFGEERPGLAASASTRFNVASITKIVTAEVTLRLAAKGRIALDEPLAAHWSEPDLAQDPRYQLLTPRLVLTHQTGLPNWRFVQKGGKLAFVRDPGTGYGYSGEGFEMLAHFLEARLGKRFPEIVRNELFAPLGIQGASIATDPTRMALPAAVGGQVPAPFCRPEGWCRPLGSWSAADDMTITLPDLARLLTAIGDARGYGARWAAERDTIRTDKGQEHVVDCAYARCPVRQGYGLGFDVIDYRGASAIGHGGSDWSELAIAYVWRPSGDGVIVLLDGLNDPALAAMAEILALLDPHAPHLDSYRRYAAARR
jgi:CubicO group peptidase (beta-lactamase class C family)